MKCWRRGGLLDRRGAARYPLGGRRTRVDAPLRSASASETNDSDRSGQRLLLQSLKRAGDSKERRPRRIPAPLLLRKEGIKLPGRMPE